MKDFKEIFLMAEFASIKAGVSQGSILGSLLFLIYNNDLSDGIISNVKLFADDTSIFSTIHAINSSACNLNPNLQSEWAFKWKMSFNPNKLKKSFFIEK